MSDRFDPNEMTPEQVAELAKAGREGAAAGQYLSQVLQGISAEEAAAARLASERGRRDRGPRRAARGGSW